MVKKTLVLGASLNADRYSNMAVKKLLLNNIDVRAVGLKIGSIDKVLIEKDYPFALIKFQDVNFSENADFNTKQTSIKIVKPDWIKS